MSISMNFYNHEKRKAKKLFGLLSEDDMDILDDQDQDEDEMLSKEDDVSLRNYYNNLSIVNDIDLEFEREKQRLLQKHITDDKERDNFLSL